MNTPPVIPADRPHRLLLRGISKAFTLVELLVVMGVIVIIIGIASPAITSLSGAGDVSKSVYDIAGILEQSRAYAMSNSTYVYVGFQEVDANSSETSKQVEVDPAKTGGRVNVAVIAAKDGTRGYDVNNTGSWATNYGSGGSFITVGKVQQFRNLHLVDLDVPPASGGMARGPYNSDTGAPVKIDDPSNLGNANCNPVTSFEYPLGNTIGGGLYTFKKVIQYDPQGIARIQTQTDSDTIAKLIEIGLEQTHGNIAATLASPAKTGAIAALQIECMTGSTHIYRP